MIEKFCWFYYHTCTHRKSMYMHHDLLHWFLNMTVAVPYNFLKSPSMRPSFSRKFWKSSFDMVGENDIAPQVVSSIEKYWYCDVIIVYNICVTGNLVSIKLIKKLPSDYLVIELLLFMAFCCYHRLLLHVYHYTIIITYKLANYRGTSLLRPSELRTPPLYGWLSMVPNGWPLKYVLTWRLN